MEPWRQRNAEVSIEIAEAVVVLDSIAVLVVTKMELAVVDRRHDAHVRIAMHELALSDLTRRRSDVATLVKLTGTGTGTGTGTSAEAAGTATTAGTDPAFPSAEAERDLAGAAMCFTFTDVRPTSPELMPVHEGRLQSGAVILGRAALRIDVPIFLPFMVFVLETFVPDGMPLKSVVDAAPLNLLDGLVALVIPTENTDPARLVKMRFAATLIGAFLERAAPPFPQTPRAYAHIVRGARSAAVACQRCRCRSVATTAAPWSSSTSATRR